MRVYTSGSTLESPEKQEGIWWSAQKGGRWGRGHKRDLVRTEPKKVPTEEE